MTAPLFLALLAASPVFSVYGGCSQWFGGRPRCTCDEAGHVLDCETSHRSLNRKSFSGRIVGGRTANILEHSYLLALEIDGSLACGAAIIGSRWAVTAGHCFADDEDLKSFELRALSNKLERGGFTFRVSEVIPHPEYDYYDDSNEHDIALLRVSKSFLKTDSRITAINLPRPNEELRVGTMVTVLGWGHTKENGRKSDHLRSVNIPITSYRHCNSKHDGDINSDLMICAGTKRGGKDACTFDSGGPLVFDNTLYGIVSFGEGCGMENVPGVYTKVSTYRKWIKQMTGV